MGKEQEKTRKEVKFFFHSKFFKPDINSSQLKKNKTHTLKNYSDRITDTFLKHTKVPRIEEKSCEQECGSTGSVFLDSH